MNKRLKLRKKELGQLKGLTPGALTPVGGGYTYPIRFTQISCGGSIIRPTTSLPGSIISGVSSTTIFCW